MLKSRQLMHKADWNMWDIAGNQFSYSRSALPAVNSILQPAPNAMCEGTIRKPYAGTAWRTENSTEIRDYSVRTNLNCVRLFGSNLWSRIPFYKQQLCTWIQTMLLMTDMLNMCHQYREIYQRNFTQNSRYPFSISFSLFRYPFVSKNYTAHNTGDFPQKFYHFITES